MSEVGLDFVPEEAKMRFVVSELSLLRYKVLSALPLIETV